MADAAKQGQGAPQVGAEQAASLLDQAIAATGRGGASAAGEIKELLQTLTDQAMSGTVTFSKSLNQTIARAVAAIDAKLSEQLAEIMHHPRYLQVEGSWRGIRHLVMNSETGPMLKIKLLNASKRDLAKDFEKAVEFDQSLLFKKIYENEFGMPGGEPYGAFIGDYEFTNHPDDIALLGGLSGVAASAFAPFISAASPDLFGMEDFRGLKDLRDLSMVFEGPRYAKWKSLRESDDARFLCLTLPRTLARLPYGRDTKPVDSFDYQEGLAATSLQHEHYCWMNSAYVLGTKLTDAFAKYQWCTAIRGSEGGGRVDNLPSHTFTSDDGDVDQKCPTEIGITDRREAELSKLGFLPLCHYKNTDYAVFFGAQTVQTPKKYDRPEATANAAISARLPYIMASSRFAHYLKIMARDKVGSFLEAQDCEAWLNRWINNYVNSNEGVGQEMKAKFPLREAKVSVEAVPGSPGSYRAVAHLRPWLQFEELTTSLRMVASIPKKA